ncbi:unnamed protein product [Caenorhabditis angaria]|uniref:Protein SPEC3 n=1 Tax=Caenorhabditis angaria TaxID=860376 RepID=A0A9P1IC16_9PELO|nr:unnamed protein product [Caenorhabditis angaria]
MARLQRLYSGTSIKDYEEYLDFDEEPQARTDHESISMSKVPIHHHGRFRSAIPIMPLSLACLCFLMNVFLPGSGTLLGGISVLCCSDPRGRSKPNCICWNTTAAILQFLSAPLIIGIIWSIIWGVMFIQIARKWFISDLDHRADFLSCCPCSSW